MFSLFKYFHFHFLYARCQFVYLRVFLTKLWFSAVYCRVFFLYCVLSCIIYYRVCSFVYTRKQYTIHDTQRLSVLKEFQNANNFNYTRLM